MAITLIGTSHLDLNGYDRLNRLLKHLKPSVIGVEETEKSFEETSRFAELVACPKNLEAVINNAQKQFPEAKPETLRLWLSKAFYENRAVSDYSRANHIPIVYCESPEEIAHFEEKIRNNRILKKVPKELSMFLSLTPEQARQDIEKEYARQVYPVADFPELVKFYSKRDEFAESVLRQSILRQQQINLVYVCGLDHIFGDYHPNLYDRLLDLNPRRIKLNEADNL